LILIKKALIVVGLRIDEGGSDWMVLVG